MPKVPTQWLPATSGIVTTANDGVIRLEQNGNTQRILQDGTTKRILQPNVIELATPTQWTPND